MRLILYTGKGGVGKSSIAAASAVRSAELGSRTLLVSSDLAHNLSDIFDTPIGGEPTSISENLTALEVDALKEIREKWSLAHEYLVGVLEYLGVENAVAEEVALYPGIDDLFVLTRILLEVKSGRYDTIIVDCSPTAGTLRYLTLSDSAANKLNKLMDIERKVIRLIRPITNRISGVRDLIPENEVYLVFEDIVGKVGELGEILKDPGISTVRLVLNPDRVSIAETRRAFTYFGLFGFPVDGIFVNKTLPVTLAEGYLHNWYTLQQDLLESIEQSFLDITKLRVPLLDKEPLGLEPLSELAQEIFIDRRPDDVLSPAKTVSLDREDGKYTLSFWLPNVERGDLDVGMKDSELILTARGYVRVFSLPDVLLDSRIESAEYADGSLTISFG